MLRRSRYFSAWTHFCLSVLIALVDLLDASRKLHVQWSVYNFSSLLLIRQSEDKVKREHECEAQHGRLHSTQYLFFIGSVRFTSAFLWFSF